MAKRLQDLEATERRLTQQVSDGTLTRCVYRVKPEDIKNGVLPAEGGPMPGTEAALLGPFLEAGGVFYGQIDKEGFQQVSMRFKTLAARS